MDEARVRAKWRDPDAGERYATQRFRSARHRDRDPRLVAALLTRHLPPARSNRLLDAPCGSGRLLASLAPFGRAVGLDVSPSMLAAARGVAGPGVPLLLGAVEAMPFPDACFDAVVCCRLLHHLRERPALERVVAELVRVSRGLVVASFWDAQSLPAWRRALGRRALGTGARAPARHARPRAEIAAALEHAGAEVLGWKHSLRFLSRQAFVVARRRARGA